MVSRLHGALDNHVLEQNLLVCSYYSMTCNAAASEAGNQWSRRRWRICEVLGLDISALWQMSDEAPDFFTLTHYYTAQDLPQLPAQTKAHEAFPWFQKQLVAGQVVSISSLDEMPAEAAPDREACRQFGVKSNLTIPLSVGGGKPVGAWGLAVHAAMAGKTGLVIGLLHDEFIHVPIELLAGRRRSVDPAGPVWRGTLAATGQQKEL
jgi:hypothetical protein